MPENSESKQQQIGKSGASSVLGQSTLDSSTPSSKKQKKKFRLTEKLATMENMQRLVRRRGAAKGKVSRILNTIRPNEEEVVQLTEAEIKVCMRKLEAAHKDYNDAHDQITNVVSNDDYEQHEQQYEEFDILHDSVAILLEDQLNRINAAAAANANARNQQVPVVIHQPLRMPVPTFDGRYESWPKFKAMFKDLVDKGHFGKFWKRGSRISVTLSTLTFMVC